MIPACIFEQAIRDAEAARRFRASLGLPPLPERKLPVRTWKDDAEEWGVALLMLVPLFFTLFFAGGVALVISLIIEAITGTKIESP